MGLIVLFGFLGLVYLGLWSLGAWGLGLEGCSAWGCRAEATEPPSPWQLLQKIPLKPLDALEGLQCAAHLVFGDLALQGVHGKRV